MYAKQHLPNGLQHQNPNQTMTKYAVIWSQNIHFITTLQVHLIKNFFNKSCWGVCTYKGNVIETNKYGIIWSQTVHFVTTLMVPPNKNLFNKSC